MIVEPPPVETPSQGVEVSCLLCGTYVSVEADDRARFVDHLTAKHEVKSEGCEVVLAVGVFTAKERLFVIKEANKRLNIIGEGKSPDYQDTFLNRLKGGHIVPTSIPGNRTRTTGRNSSTAAFRGAVASSLQSVASRGGLGAGSRSLGQGAAASTVPSILSSTTGSLSIASNASISISQVDMRRECHMCNETLTNPAALVDHINSVHFSSFGGVNIMSEESREQSNGPRNQKTSSVGMMTKCQDCGKSMPPSRLAVHRLSHKGGAKGEIMGAKKGNSSVVSRKSDSSVLKSFASVRGVANSVRGSSTPVREDVNTVRRLPTTTRKSVATVKELPATVRVLPATGRLSAPTVRRSPATVRGSLTTVRQSPTPVRGTTVPVRGSPVHVRGSAAPFRVYPAPVKVSPATIRGTPAPGIKSTVLSKGSLVRARCGLNEARKNEGKSSPLPYGGFKQNLNKVSEEVRKVKMIEKKMEDHKEKKDLKKEIAGLNTLQLLDNLVNFLSD